MRQQVDPYLICLFVALIAAAFIGIFKSHLLKRLSTRITLLILISGPLAAFLFSSTTKMLIHFDILNRPGSPLVTLLYVLITLGTPVILGLIAAYFVWRPLRHFSDTITSLKQNDYRVQLSSTGISEFDEVFSEFNDLIKRLQNEEKLRKDLISDTSHELNTPLTSMLGQLTAMQEGKLPITRKRITALKEQIERLADLIQQLDVYTKTRRPNTDVSHDINLRKFCNELLLKFELEFKRKQIIPILHIAEDYVIRANKNSLESIFTNLVQNTLRYSEATEFSISANNREITFSDNGKGVPDESLPYLFERFYRVDKSRNRESGGLGLGLAIVKELIEQQGWHVHAESNRPGLSFTIDLR